MAHRDVLLRPARRDPRRSSGNASPAAQLAWGLNSGISPARSNAQSNRICHGACVPFWQERDNSDFPAPWPTAYIDVLMGSGAVDATCLPGHAAWPPGWDRTPVCLVLLRSGTSLPQPFASGVLNVAIWRKGDTGRVLKSTRIGERAKTATGCTGLSLSPPPRAPAAIRPGWQPNGAR